MGLYALRFLYEQFVSGLKDKQIVNVPFKDKGLCYALDRLWNHSNTTSVDFSKFTYDDLERLEVEWNDSFEYCSDSDDFILKNDSSIHVYMETSEAIYYLFHNKNKLYGDGLETNFFF